MVLVNLLSKKIIDFSELKTKNITKIKQIILKQTINTTISSSALGRV